MSVHWTTVETRLGAFRVASNDGKIVLVQLPGQELTQMWAELARMFPNQNPSPTVEPVLAAAATQLQEFAEGARHEFELPVELHGTDFQKQVWQTLMGIPYGETRSYGDVAKTIGNPGASRAVGGANRANHLPLVVPCHRVIASDGSLGGYMGAWADEAGLKPRLLELERSF